MVDVDGGKPSNEGVPGLGTDEEFHAAVEPFRAAMVELVDETLAVRTAVRYQPAPTSPAASELAVQHQFAGEWGRTPVVDVHALGWMQLVVAEDLVRSLSREFAAPGPSPAYGHVVLARAAIESCARAAWLADPSIDVRRRIARGESERLYSIAEAAKLPGATMSEDPRRRILAEADRQGFERKSSKNQSVVSLDEWRPGQTKLVRWLYPQDGDMGELIYRW